jgi:hypothetical protein
MRIKYIIITIILCVLILLLINYIRQRKKIRQKEKLSNIHIKSGDLIFFKHDNGNINNISMFFGDEFTHIGIVTEIDGELYLCETVSKGDIYKLNDRTDGVKMVKLYDRIKTYEGYVFIKKLNKSLTKEQINILNTFYNNKKNIPFCNLYSKVKVMKYIFKCLTGIKNEDFCTFCSAFIADVLVKMKIIYQLKMNNMCYRPMTLHDELKFAKYRDGFSYEPTIEIDIDE